MSIYYESYNQLITYDHVSNNKICSDFNDSNLIFSNTE